MAAVYHDRKGQLDKIQAVVRPGEEIKAVGDLKGEGTSFLGVTSPPVIFDDNVFLRRMKAIVSIPYNRITSISAEDESGPLTGRG